METAKDKPKSESLLTVKERNWAVRNSILKSTNQRINDSMQNERHQFAKSMDFQAKKLREKLTLMMPSTKPSGAKNDARSSAKEDSDDKLKLPVIKRDVKSAPSSPNLGGRNSVFSCDNLSVSPSGREDLVRRRGSYNDIESPRGSPVISRQTRRSFSYHGERRPTLVPPILTGIEEGNDKVSPLIPRNLKLREAARRGSVLKAVANERSAQQSQTLEDQFKSLGTCRYLRRGTEGDLKELAKETPNNE